MAVVFSDGLAWVNVRAFCSGSVNIQQSLFGNHPKGLDIYILKVTDSIEWVINLGLI